MPLYTVPKPPLDSRDLSVASASVKTRRGDSCVPSACAHHVSREPGLCRAIHQRAYKVRQLLHAAGRTSGKKSMLPGGLKQDWFGLDRWEQLWLLGEVTGTKQGWLRRPATAPGEIRGETLGLARLKRSMPPHARLGWLGDTQQSVRISGWSSMRRGARPCRWQRLTSAASGAR